MADDNNFFSRWSRRKQAVLAGQPLPEAPAASVPAPAASPATVAAAPAAPQMAAPAAPEAPAQPLPTLDDVRALTPESDFSAFVARGVSPEVRNAAVKKLFADPHFNVMDGLDIYIDDYSQPNPLPLALAKKLASAQFMKLFDEPEQTPKTETTPPNAPPPAAAPGEEETPPTP